ncbi:MAG: autotransporter outer membrane beta-barrel domain-containing protein [Planctomycetaceae bacterium]|jgi:uncharacterized protein with beta-barrel porin domain|nr:autotransporter outer membrane beta-barrel domain-containing protein [Planctomycetaceae bacterium]
MRCFILLLTGFCAFPLPVFSGGTQTFRWAGFTQTQQTPQNQYRLWLKTFSHWSEGEILQNHPCTFSSYGAAAGIDRQCGKNWLFGLAAGENETTVKTDVSRYQTGIAGWNGMVYVRKTGSYCYVDVEGHYAQSRYKNTHTHAYQWGIAGETGIWRDHGLGKIEPFLRLSHIGCGSQTEEETQNMLLAGIRYSWQTTSTFSSTVPRVYAGLLQEIGSSPLFQVASFGNTPAVFMLRGGQPPPSRLFLGGGFTTSMGTSLDVLLRYTAEISPHLTSHTVLLGVNCNF